MGHAVFGNLKVVFGERGHHVLVVVEDRGVQDHLIDIALQGVSPLSRPISGRVCGLVGRGALPVRGGNGITVDIEWPLLFRLGGRGRRRTPPARRLGPASCKAEKSVKRRAIYCKGA